MQIDHLVLRVSQLDEAIAAYEQRGFTVARGGRHPDFGTHNALIPFADGSYLELLAPLPGAEPRPPQTTPERRVATWRRASGGLVDWALLPDDLDAAIAAARARGVTLDGPYPGRRTRPDGQEVAWRFAFPPTLALPFLCADITDRERRVPGGPARTHANGARGISRLVLTAVAPATSAAELAALSGAEARADDDGWSLTLGSATLSLIAGEVTALREAWLEAPTPIPLP